MTKCCCRLFSGLLAAILVAGTASAELKVGDVAPAFQLPGSDGKTHSLADHLNKNVVVLIWFPKAFTGG